MSDEKNIGIISDTHGLLRPEVAEALTGCDYILHAGDVGDGKILKALALIAPLVAVRGNMDYGAWSNALPAREMVEIAGIFFYLMHDLQHLDLEPSAAGIQVVVSGHTHQPKIYRKGDVIYLNPGSAGHRRHNYPISLALVSIKDGTVSPRIVEIDG